MTMIKNLMLLSHYTEFIHLGVVGLQSNNLLSDGLFTLSLPS
jgi:hypothetical protein